MMPLVHRFVPVSPRPVILRRVDGSPDGIEAILVGETWIGDSPVSCLLRIAGQEMYVAAGRVREIESAPAPENLILFRHIKPTRVRA